jgi:20S proteasome alpha/beta subunit
MIDLKGIVKMGGIAVKAEESKLYLPLEINTRLHPKEPRPRQGKSMTIAAGFRCSDGVVICTDSEHTAGQAKHYGPKIFEEVAGNGALYVAGAGTDVYIGAVAKEIGADIQGKTIDFDSIEALTQARVMEVYSRHIAPARQASDPDAPSLALLLAIRITGQRARLYRVEETGGVNLVDSGVAVVGTQAAETLIRNLADILSCDNFTSVSTMRAIAVHLISRAARFASYCGGSAQVVCLSDDGTALVRIEASQDPSDDPLESVFSNLSFVLEVCASGNAAEFKAALGHLNAVFERIMEKRKKEQADYLSPQRKWMW